MPSQTTIPTLQRILVTGVNGFIGSHTAVQLLEAGYIVRGTVRSSKLHAIKSSLGNLYPNLEIVRVDDIATSDMTNALKGVDAVIHVASHVVGRLPAVDVLNSAISGTLNVLRQSVAAGINKFVLTGTAYSILDPAYRKTKPYRNRSFTRKDWGTVGYTTEEIIQGSFHPTWVYASSKILGEQAAWDFAAAHPQLDLAVILPPFVYGPFAPHFPVSKNNLASNYPIYAILNGKQPSLLFPFFSDVRDIARAHVTALTLPPVRPTEDPQTKRFLLTTGIFTWRDALEHIKTYRPELGIRISRGGLTGENIQMLDREGMIVDSGNANRVLGLEDEDGSLIGWRKCLRDTIDSLLEAERKWREDSTSKEEIRARL